MFSFLPEKPKIIKESDEVFVIEINNLYPGYGTTIGNSLRRVLLSSLGGAAITQVKIKSDDNLILHEFSTINGVLEDVVTIIQNLKKIRFEFPEEDENKEYSIFLSVKKEGQVRGGNFKVPSQIRVINKEQLVATATSRVNLEIEAKVKKGIGYVPGSQHSKEEKETEAGVIFIDSIFTPIKKVSFKSENIRVGERVDFNKLLLEIETDKTITPKNAFLKAIEILKKQLEEIEKI